MGHIAVLETLEKLGADLNLANNEGTTPVFIAAQNGNIPMMEALVKLGADINIYNKCGATPLFIVSQNGCKKSVEFLISKGAQWDHPYVSSRSSLLKFCEAYSSDVLKRLEDTIDEQLKDPAKDEEHIALLPIDIARIMGNEEIVILLNQLEKETQKKDHVSFFAPKPELKKPPETITDILNKGI